MSFDKQKKAQLYKLFHEILRTLFQFGASQAFLKFENILCLHNLGF